MLPKAYEQEKLGHFCLNGDRLEVVEYSDMPDELTSKRDESGKLLFIAGSVAIHVYQCLSYKRLWRKTPYFAAFS